MVEDWKTDPFLGGLLHLKQQLLIYDDTRCEAEASTGRSFNFVCTCEHPNINCVTS